MKNDNLTENEFTVLAQLVDQGIRASGIQVANAGDEFISALRKFFALKPEQENKEEPKKE
jgi:hypothetical protein